MENLVSRISKIYKERTSENQWNEKKLRLYEKIYVILKEAILNNDIPEGSLLPSTRTLASELNVSRSTVIKSYELLLMENHLEATTGTGYTVKSIVSERPPSNPEKFNSSTYPDLSETGKSFKKNLTLISSSDDKGIAFVPGLPPLDLFPVNQWKNLSNLYWRHIRTSELTYAASSGSEQLKKSIANYLNMSRGIKCDTRQIIIVSGSVQSLYLIGSILLNPGDHMSMENPTFPNVISLFRGLRSNIQPVNIDKDGLIVSELYKDSHRQSKLIHTAPSCHYPSGVKMTIERRIELLKWANQYQKIIIENDYEHEVNNYKDFIPSIFSLDTQQRTIFLGTFNRLLHPSIRIGYMIVPFYLLDAVEALLKHSHRVVPSSIQVVLSQFIDRNYLYTHVKNLIEVAEERKMLFSETFKSCFDESLVLEESKTRSLHVLAKLKEEFSDIQLADYLAKQNIITHAYSKCFVQDTPCQGLIMGCTPVRSPVIRQKLTQMERLWYNFRIK